MKGQHLAFVYVYLTALLVTHTQGQPGNCNEGAVRLVQSSRITTRNAGRVEVCLEGVWGTIAANLFETPWSEKNAQVACRQMGYQSGAINSILQNTTIVSDRADSSVPVHYRGVRCDGTEGTLQECALIRVTPGETNHLLDVFIVCQPISGSYSALHPPGPQPGDIRLLGTPLNGAGAVEIYTSQIGWTGICPDTAWTDEDASTVCRAFGYDSGTANTVVIENGAIQSRLASNAVCDNRGVVASLESPFLAGVCSLVILNNPNDCLVRDNIYAGVVCTSTNRPQSVRLTDNIRSDFNDDDRPNGIVEILYNDRWGVICRDSPFNVGDGLGRVVCREHGYDDGDVNIAEVSMESLRALRQVSSLRPVWLSIVQCGDPISSVSQCTVSRPVGYAGCTSGNIIAVQCGKNPSSSGLSGGAIAGIVIGVLFFLFIIGGFFGGGADKKKKRREAARAAALSEAAARQHIPPTATQPEPPSQPVELTATNNERRSSSSSSDSETKDSQARRSSLTKPPPPSYNKSSDFDTPQPEAPPPAYPGAPGPNFAPYPPEATAGLYPNVPYPVQQVVPGPDTAYPPAAGGLYQYNLEGPGGQNLAYPPPTNPNYPPPNLQGLPYPTDETSNL